MPTLTSYRQWLGQELAAYLGSTATAGTTTTLVDTAALKTTVDGTQTYKDYYLLRPTATSADQVRSVDTYAPSTGTLTVDLPYAVAPAAGEAYELHGILHPVTEMLPCINEALKRCLVTTEFSLTPVALQQRHSLTSAAPWLTNPVWVQKVGTLLTSLSRLQYNPYDQLVTGQAVQDGPTVYLDHPGIAFSTSQLLYVTAGKPAYYGVQASGSGAYTQTGLSLEADVAIPPVDWVGCGALAVAWGRYGHILGTADNSRLLRDRAEYAARFSSLTGLNYQPESKLFLPLRGFAVGRRFGS